MSDPGPDAEPSDQSSPDRPRIIRRQPGNGVPSSPQPVRDEPHTSIIRRHPSGAIPAIDDPSTSIIDRGVEDEASTRFIPRATPVTIPSRTPARPSPKGAVVTAVVSIISGWATAVIATDLITGWWRSDPLFCVAVGFLTAVSAAATIGGLILLLLRRRMGRLLIVVGAIVALLIFGSLFVAGAKLEPVVYAIPVLPLASIVLALLPATRRWSRS